MNGKCVSQVSAGLREPRRVPQSIGNGKRDRPAGPWQQWALHWTAGLLVTALLPSVALPAQTDAVDRVKTAISAYNAAMETKPRDQRLRQFAIAEQLFRQLVDGDAKHAPIHNADLYVNLGNAALQAEHLGPAIVAYHRALDLNPRNARARQNLEYAQSLLPDWVQPEVTNQWIDSLFFWHGTLSRGQIMTGAAICFLLAACMLAIGQIRRTLLWRNLAFVPALGWLILGISLLFDPAQTTASDAVMISESTVHTADSENAAARTSKPLPSGTAVQVLQRRDRWSEVRIPDGRTGWVRTAAIELEKN